MAEKIEIEGERLEEMYEGDEVRLCGCVCMCVCMCVCVWKFSENI